MPHLQKRMNKRLVATLLVVLHFLVVMGHGQAHLQLQIQSSIWQSIFITLVIVIGPLLAALLLWTRLARMGTIALLATMVGSLLFGVAYHFLVPGTDNAMGLHNGHWESVFRMTATWLALIETCAVAWCVWNLKSDSLKTARANGFEIS